MDGAETRRLPFGRQYAASIHGLGGQAAAARRGVDEVYGWGVVVPGETPVPRRN